MRIRSQHVLNKALKKGSKLWQPSLGTGGLLAWPQHSPFPSLASTVRGCVAEEPPSRFPTALTASTRLLWHQDGPVHSHVSQSPCHALMSLRCPQFVQELVTDPHIRAQTSPPQLPNRPAPRWGFVSPALTASRGLGAQAWLSCPHLLLMALALCPPGTLCKCHCFFHSFVVDRAWSRLLHGLFSSCTEWGYSLVAVLGVLTAVVSSCCRATGSRAQGLH